MVELLNHSIYIIVINLQINTISQRNNEFRNHSLGNISEFHKLIVKKVQIHLKMLRQNCIKLITTTAVSMKIVKEVEEPTKS